MAIELAAAYLTILPSLQGVGAAIKNEIEPALGEAGESGGAQMVEGLAAVLEKGQGLISKALDKAKSQFKSDIMSNMFKGFKRADILNNFPRVMESLGYEADVADASIQKIASHLSGLPSSTSEVATNVQMLTATLGDLEYATDIGVAFNDMMLAGGQGTEAAARSLTQLNQMLALGKVDAQSWGTIVQTASGQMDQLAKSLLGAEANQKTLYAALQDGTVSMQEFTDKIIQLDIEGGEGFSSFEEQARAATGGIMTAIENVGNRAAIGWANIVNKIGSELISDTIYSYANLLKESLNAVATYVEVPARAILTGFKGALDGLTGFIKAFNDFNVVPTDSPFYSVAILASGIQQSLAMLRVSWNLARETITAPLNDIPLVSNLKQKLEELAVKIKWEVFINGATKLQEKMESFAEKAAPKIELITRLLNNTLKYPEAAKVYFTGAIGLIKRNITNSIKDTIKKFQELKSEVTFDNAFDLLKEKAGQIFDKLVERFPVLGTIATKIQDKLGPILTDAKAKFDAFFDPIKQKLEDLGVLDDIHNAWARILETGEHVKQTFSTVFAKIKEQFSGNFSGEGLASIEGRVTSIADIVDKIVTFAGTLAINTMPIVSNGLEAWHNFVTPVKDAFETLAGTVMDSLTGKVEPLSESFDSIVAAVKDLKIGETFQTAIENMSEHVPTIVDSLTTFATNHMEGVKSFITDVEPGLTTFITTLGDFAGGSLDKLTSGLASASENLPTLGAFFGGKTAVWLLSMSKAIENASPWIEEHIVPSLKTFIQDVKPGVEAFLDKVEPLVSGIGTELEDICTDIATMLGFETDGETFGTKVSNFLFDLSDKLPTVETSVGNLSDKFSDLFSSITTGITTGEWTGVATWISDTFVTPLETQIKEADFSQAASNLMSTISSFIDDTNIVDLSGTVSEKAGEFIGQALHDINWEGVSNGIKQTIQNFFNGIQSTDFDFGAFAFGVLTAIGTGVSALVDGIMDLVTGGRWSVWVNDVYDEAGEFDAGAFALGILNAIGEGLNGLVDGIMDFVTGGQWSKWVDGLETFQWPDFGGIFGGLWEDVSKKTGEIWSGITSDLDTTWGSLTTNATNAWSNDIGPAIASGWDAISNGAGEVWASITGNLSTAWTNIETTATDLWTNHIQPAISDPIGTAKTALVGEDGSGGFVGDIKKGLEFAGISSEMLDPIFSGISAVISDPIGEAKKALLGEDGKSGFVGDIIAGLGFGDLSSDDAEKAILSIQSAIENPLQSAHDFLFGETGVVTAIVQGLGFDEVTKIDLATVFGGVQSAIEDPLTFAKNTLIGEDGTSGIVGAIESALGFAGITGTEDVFNGIRDFIKDPIETAKTALLGEDGTSGAIGAIKSTLNDLGIDTEPIESLFSTIGTSISSHITDAHDALLGEGGIIDSIKSNLEDMGIDPDVIEEVFQGVANAIQNPLGTAMNLLVGDDGKSGAIGAIVGFLNDLGINETTISGIFDRVGGFFSDPIGESKKFLVGEDGASGAIGAITGFLNDLGINETDINEIFTNVGLYMVNYISAAHDNLVGENGFIPGIVNKLNDMGIDTAGIAATFEEVKNGITTALGQAWSFVVVIAQGIAAQVEGIIANINRANEAQNSAASGNFVNAYGAYDGIGVGDEIYSGMPGHATGGIITQPEVSLIGEAGVEAVIPLQHRQYMEPFAAAIASDLSKYRLGGAGTVYNVYMDGIRYNDSEDMRDITREYLGGLRRLGAI